MDVRIAAAVPDPSDPNLSDDKFSIAPRAIARPSVDCAELELSVRVQPWFNRVPEQGARVRTRVFALVRSSSTRSATGLASTRGGTVVRVRVRAACRQRDGDVVVGVASRNLSVPADSCHGGPLRVYDVRGRALQRDEMWTQTTARVHVDDVVAPGAELRIERGGYLVMAAPECNGFRATLFGGKSRSGSYDSGRGWPFQAERADVVADARAGAFYANGIPIEALSRACSSCATRPASFEIRTIDGSVVVRVRRGAVRVGPGPTRRVRAGFQVTTHCGRGDVCTPLQPRPFEAGQPWEPDPRPRLRRLASAVEALPHQVPVERLAPAGAEVVSRPIGGGVFVEWERRVRDGTGTLRDQRGWIVWRAPRGGTRQWRLAWARRFGPDAHPYARVGDVTGDGRPELLVTYHTQGTGICGTRRVLTLARTGIRQLFRRSMCDGEIHAQGGRLVLTESAYTAHDSHCCPTFTRVTTHVWTGRSFAPRHTEVFWNCIDRRCVRWRAGPLRFVPAFSAFWDDRRGVAVGGTRPWLIARTSTGGREWEIVDASVFPLGPPRIARRGRATAALRDCGRCDGFTVVRTTDYGRTWGAR